MSVSHLNGILQILSRDTIYRVRFASQWDPVRLEVQTGRLELPQAAVSEPLAPAESLLEMAPRRAQNAEFATVLPRLPAPDHHAIMPGMLMSLPGCVMAALRTLNPSVQVRVLARQPHYDRCCGTAHLIPSEKKADRLGQGG